MWLESSVPGEGYPQSTASSAQVVSNALLASNVVIFPQM